MKKSSSKKLSITLLLITLIFLIIGVLGYKFIQAPIIPSDSPPLILTIDASTSASQFVSLLKNKHLIQHPKLLLEYIKFKKLTQKIKAGTYEIQPGETILGLLQQVISGEVLIQKFTIIEGSTQQKIAEDLEKANYLQYRPEDWLNIQGTHANAEGLLLADTYQYAGGSKSITLLEQAHKNLSLYLDKAWNGRAANLPYNNPYELLIAASIIEKETALAEEKKLISGVLANRLNKKMPLQMDPTIIYGLGANYTGKLSHQNMQIDSPYNSYTHRGLPPTPIAMVGKEAIDAAAHPQLSSYVYFFAKGDGSHQFSETYEQQKKAIEQFRKKD